MTNSEHVPNVLAQALKKIQAHKESPDRIPVPIEKTSRRVANKLPVRVAMRRKLVAHGAGVFEDKETGDLWYREGEFLVRQAIDVNQIVEDYIKSCEGV